MPPKKKNNNPNAALKAECLRHPKDAEGSCFMNNVNALKKCTSTSDNTSLLWPGFKDDTSDAGVDKLVDAAACDKLLDHVYKAAQDACNTTSTLVEKQARDTMEGSKKKSFFEQVPVTKQMLEYAFQNAEKKKGKAKPSTAIASASTPASSSAPTTATAPAVPSTSINQTASAFSGLQLSNTATSATSNQTPLTSSNAASGSVFAPTAGNPGSSQPAPPLIAPANPLKELSKEVPEVGVKRPAPVGVKPDQRVRTNYFRVDLAKKKSGGAHVLHEYQITGLLVDRPNNLSRSKKKVMIKRFVQQSGFLNAVNAPFVSNAEGRVIAWDRLHQQNLAAGVLVDQQNVPDYDRDQHGVVSQNFSMSLYYVRTINLSDLKDYAEGNNEAYPASVAEEALNILLGQAVTESNTGAIQIGDNHFFMPNSAQLLGGWGMVALRGYTSHVKARQGNLYLNVNTALSAFYKADTVNWHIQEFVSPRTPNSYPSAFLGNHRARQHLVGLRVRIRYKRDKPGEIGSTKDTPEGRLKSITGFSDEFADQIFFVNSLGVKVSVWSHFQALHKTEANQSSLKGKQICVNTSSTQTGRECWLLSDQLDVVPGQIYRKTLDRLNPNMTAKMVELACRPPVDNQKSIETEGLQALGFRPNTEKPPVRLLEAGLSVAKKMESVPSQIIKPPSIMYKNGLEPQYMAASTWKTQGVKFLSDERQQAFRGTTGIKFFCSEAGLARAPEQHRNDYITGFERAWQLNYDKPQANIEVNHQWQRFADMKDLSKVIGTLQKSKAGLFVLVLRSANAQVRPSYANFRIAADQVLGKPSIVMCEERILGSTKPDKMNFVPYMANNAMKISSRLGGQNHSTDGFSSLSPGDVCNTLVLGADLIHPKATSAEVCPTIACLVGSVSGNFAKFLGSARRQSPRKEIISSATMISMATERIMDWQRANSGRLPARILYYRDGTGITQYSGVLTEVAAIKTAWQNVAGPQHSAKVALTAVVAVKRHTTRLFPESEENTTSTGNCWPGTVVNTRITSPYFFDFYLQSHDVEKKGSAKPTHYYVLTNDMGFSESSLHQLTYAFCYNFSHSASSVSYASPAFYADRLCERVMLYLREFFDNDQSIQDLGNDTMRNSAMEAAWDRGGQGPGRNPWHQNFNNKMFWM